MLLLEFALVTANSRTFCSLWRKRQGVCARPWISSTCRNCVLARDGPHRVFVEMPDVGEIWIGTGNRERLTRASFVYNPNLVEFPWQPPFLPQN